MNHCDSVMRWVRIFCITVNITVWALFYLYIVR